MSRPIMFIQTFSVLAFATIIYLNLTGFCYSQWRYVPEDEFVRKAVERTLELSPADAKNIETRPINADDVISYSSVDEFIDRNKDCCHVARQYPDHYDDILGPKWTRLFGFYTLVVDVWFQYKVSPLNNYYVVRYFASACNNVGKPSGSFMSRARKAGETTW